MLVIDSGIGNDSIIIDVRNGSPIPPPASWSISARAIKIRWRCRISRRMRGIPRGRATGRSRWQDHCWWHAGHSKFQRFGERRRRQQSRCLQSQLHRYEWNYFDRWWQYDELVRHGSDVASSTFVLTDSKLSIAPFDHCARGGTSRANIHAGEYQTRESDRLDGQ